MEIVDLLKEGKLIGFPTDTVYGVGAAFSRLDGIKEIFTLKGRSLNKPLIAHVSTLEMALSLVSDLSDEFLLLAGAFWPGPLTLIAKKAAHVPDLITAGHTTLGIRIPGDELTRTLIDSLGEPIIGTSANISGAGVTCTAKGAQTVLGQGVAYYLEGECASGVASTVYSLEEKAILREGAITQNHLQAVLQTL